MTISGIKPKAILNCRQKRVNLLLERCFSLDPKKNIYLDKALCVKGKIFISENSGIELNLSFHFYS